MAHVYLIKLHDNVYKVGRTIAGFDKNGHLKRVSAYKNKAVIAVYNVPLLEVCDIEQAIVDIFNHDFIRHKGREYFKGHELLMQAVIEGVIRKDDSTMKRLIMIRNTTHQTMIQEQYTLNQKIMNTVEHYKLQKGANVNYNKYIDHLLERKFALLVSCSEQLKDDLNSRAMLLSSDNANNENLHKDDRHWRRTFRDLQRKYEDLKEEIKFGTLKYDANECYAY